MDEAFDEYFTFTGKQRIDNNGSFGFNFRSDLRSAQKFTVSKSNVEITAKCRVYNANTGSLTKDASKSFTLTVYDAATGTRVDDLKGYANHPGALPRRGGGGLCRRHHVRGHRRNSHRRGHFIRMFHKKLSFGELKFFI